MSRKFLQNIILMFVIFPGSGAWIVPSDPEPAVPEFMAAALEGAGVPEIFWEDFTSVAFCESRLDASAEGDGVWAKGLFQIHWLFWSAWAEGEGLGEFPEDAWSDPIINTRLAWLIGEHYDMPEFGERWFQWTMKPWWRECQEWKE